MSRMKMGLFAALLAAMFVGAAGAAPILPVSDFSNAADWKATGDGSVSGGVGKLGTNLASCYGREPFGFSGSLTAVTPTVLLATLEFDYKVHTADTVSYDWLQMDAVNALDNTVKLIGKFNPSTSFSCRDFTGHKAQGVPGSLQGTLAFVKLSARQDGFGDTFYIEVDNLAGGA